MVKTSMTRLLPQCEESERARLGVHCLCVCPNLVPFLPISDHFQIFSVLDVLSRPQAPFLCSTPTSRSFVPFPCPTHASQLCSSPCYIKGQMVDGLGQASLILYSARWLGATKIISIGFVLSLTLTVRWPRYKFEGVIPSGWLQGGLTIPVSVITDNHQVRLPRRPLPISGVQRTDKACHVANTDSLSDCMSISLPFYIKF